jgi:hypothetical protein
MPHPIAERTAAPPPQLAAGPCGGYSLGFGTAPSSIRPAAP